MGGGQKPLSAEEQLKKRKALQEILDQMGIGGPNAWASGQLAKTSAFQSAAKGAALNAMGSGAAGGAASGLSGAAAAAM